MDKDILFFKVVSRKAIWGGTLLENYFGYDVPKDTGQVWAFSAQKGGDTVCSNGMWSGIPLSVIWKEYPEIFQSKKKEFPYIISLVAPLDNLSVQVHPTSNIAAKKGFSSGKNEAWVVLKAENNSSLVYGSKVPIEELIRRIKSGNYDNIFNSIKVENGDFVYIPAGTVHGLKKNIIVYEVQEATDLTYRIYDYDRTDKDGKPREMNIGDAVDSIFDAKDEYNTSLKYVSGAPREIARQKNLSIHEYINNESFSITSLECRGTNCISNKRGYWLCTVVDGNGTINGVEIEFADNFIIPVTIGQLSMEGNFRLMITSEESIIHFQGGNENEKK